MKLINFGSMNYDKVYRVPGIVKPGETITAHSLTTFFGGKGLNQSVALARAGAKVYHAGLVGTDGAPLKEFLRENGVDVSLIETAKVENGQAIIQVDDSGQNSIFLFPGSNRAVTPIFAGNVLCYFEEGDYILLQNEISSLGEIIKIARERGMKIILNPSPFDEHLDSCDLSAVDTFLLNEVEGEAVSGTSDPKRMADAILEQYPKSHVVLTLGKQGVLYKDASHSASHGIFEMPVIDTTAAGDTFTGYYIAGMLEGQPVESALRLASMAAALAVSREGAAPSIPLRAEVDAALEQQK
ncbi:MAG: ribokinase [Oscillospiraceae bacterium]|nr:ribokinase [Oscillospiraceae bacterium]